MNSLPLDAKGRLLTNAPDQRTRRENSSTVQLILPPLLDDETPLEQRLHRIAEWVENECKRTLATTRNPQERARVREAYNSVRYTQYHALSQLTEE